MKYFKIITLLLIMFPNLLLTQTEEPPQYTGEIAITNSSTTRTIYLKVYPVSMIFNGRYFYDLHTLYPDNIGDE